MMKTIDMSVLIDAREFVEGRLTGIGRFLKGLTDALAESNMVEEILLAVYDLRGIPSELKNRKKIKFKKIPPSFLRSERNISALCRDRIILFISPYPKLPLFGCQSVAIHTIHDVLDLTHPAYKNRFKTFLDRLRLRSALKKASLTWYVSSWSLKETEDFIGYAGKNPKVRYNGIDERFLEVKNEADGITLKKYGLETEYILVIGNGLPHKNLEVLLRISDELEKVIVFVGVSKKQQEYWKSLCPDSKAVWINHVVDQDLSAIIRGAFCLAQPSTAEGYGYPPLEAMACGVPAVVSNIQVLKESTGSNVLIADPHDSKEWIEAFRVLENRDNYQNQVKKGLKWVEPLIGRKGWQKHVSDINELIGAI
jgi:glycosyltransferase involved in cell wall biosynthesis